ncbi:MAG: CoA transferase [Dehalococcoidia bacterium]|nr:CoA transferase [Dehalococcoidia bacterium]
MGRIGILTDFRVIDLSHAVAGPSGSQLLGDLGAEVIKIEPPTGDFSRGSTPRLGDDGFFYLAVNRNKKSIVLDLYSRSGRGAFHDLVKVSDVVLDNFRPGVLQRLQGDYDSLKAINPRIISCSVTGFGPSGPYRDHPAFDDIPMGISGAYSLCGEPGGHPIRMPLHAADLAAGFFAVTGILAALLKRERTGLGCNVAVSMLDAIMYYMASDFQSYFISGEPPRASGSRHPRAPMVGVFETRNGYLVLGPSWPRIAKVIGKEWMITDPRFSTVEKRFENKKGLEDLIEDGLREADTGHWLEIMRREDIAAGPVNSLDQTVKDPQVVHNQTIVSMKHPSLGEIRGIECPIKISGEETSGHMPPPTLGQHTEEVLRGVLGYTTEQIAAVRREQEEMWKSRSRGEGRL